MTSFLMTCACGMVTSRPLYNKVDILIAVTQHPLPRRATYNIVMKYYIPGRPLKSIIYLVSTRSVSWLF